MDAIYAVFLILLHFAVALAIALAVLRKFQIIFFIKRNTPVVPEKFTVTAHTGCLGTVSNTVESMEKGVTAGSDIVEFDLNFNKNGEPVLSHDAPEAGAVHLSDAFKFLSEHKNTKANIDLKSFSNLPAVVKLSEEYGVTEQIFFTGIFPKNVTAVERFCPQIPFYLNYSVNHKGSTDFAYLSHVMEIVRNCGAIGINIDYKSASKQLIEAFHNEGLLVSVWTVNSKYAMVRTLKLCPDNITTKRPDILLELL